MLLPWLLSPLLLGAQATPAVLPFADRYDNAFAEAKARNVPVLVLDFDGWVDDPKQTQWSAYYEDKEFLAAAQKAVLVLASQDAHGDQRQVVDGVERTTCSKYGGTSCAAHRDQLPKVFTDFGKNGELRTPLIVVAAPDHKEIGRFEHETPTNAVVDLLKQAEKQLGPGLKRADYLRLVNGVKEITQRIASKEYEPAVALCEDLKKIPGAFEPQKQLANAEELLATAGGAMLRHANDAWAGGRFSDALFEMEEVRATFAKLPCGAAAATTMATWEKAPEAKALLPGLKNDRAARQLMQQAAEFERKGDVRHAVPPLERIVSSYPETRFAPRAKALLERLKPAKK